MFGAYQRWCRTTSTRAQYFEKMLDMCGLIDDPDCPKVGKHRELERAEIKKSEDAVQRTMSAVSELQQSFFQYRTKTTFTAWRPVLLFP